MYYLLVRAILSIVVLVISLFSIVKFKLKRRRRWEVLACVISILLFSLSSFFPLENLFIRFPTPEAAFHYVYSGDEIYVIDGNDTSLLLSETQAGYDYCIIPKTEDGWKIGLSSDTREICVVRSDCTPENVLIYINHYKQSDDYYVTVDDLGGAVYEIYDNFESEFVQLDFGGDAFSGRYSKYCSCIHNFDNRYMITINGETIVLLDESIRLDR